MKALKCTPKSKREWEVVLELARALEIGNGFAYIYDSNSSIWNNRGYGPVCPLFNDAHEGAGEELTVPSFIRSMYQLAEERKKPKFDFTIWDTMRYTKWNSGSDLCKDLQSQLRDKNLSDLEKRVKELEGSFERLESGNLTTNDMLSNACKNVWTAHDRLEKLEKVVSEEMASVREERVHGLCGGHKDWVVMKFDTKASPKNLPFEIALAYAKDGRYIRRRCWTNPDNWLSVSDGVLYSTIPCANPNRQDCLTFENTMANDWYVL